MSRIILSNVQASRSEHMCAILSPIFPPRRAHVLCFPSNCSQEAAVSKARHCLRHHSPIFHFTLVHQVRQASITYHQSGWETRQRRRSICKQHVFFFDKIVGECHLYVPSSIKVPKVDGNCPSCHVDPVQLRVHRAKRKILQIYLPSQTGPLRSSWEFCLGCI